METTTQDIRLSNLRLLHARPGGAGGPTSDFLVHFLNEKGVSITKKELSEIYWRRRAIGDYLSAGIERAFELPSGWLSEDCEFLFKLNSGELSAVRSLFALSGDVKEKVLSLIVSIAQRKEE